MEFTTILWCGMFSWTSKNCHASWSRHLRNLRNQFFANCKSSVSSIGGLTVIFASCEFEGPPCVSVFSQHFQLTLLQAGDTMCCSTRGLSRNNCFNWVLGEKGDICSVKACQGNWERVSLWCQEVHLFRHVWIVLPATYTYLLLYQPNYENVLVLLKPK